VGEGLSVNPWWILPAQHHISLHLLSQNRFKHALVICKVIFLNSMLANATLHLHVTQSNCWHLSWLGTVSLLCDCQLNVLKILGQPAWLVIVWVIKNVFFMFHMHTVSSQCPTCIEDKFQQESHASDNSGSGKGWPLWWKSCITQCSTPLSESILQLSSQKASKSNKSPLSACGTVENTAPHMASKWSSLLMILPLLPQNS